MSVFLVVLYWVALSCLASPLIGAMVFQQFRDDADYLKQEHPRRAFEGTAGETATVPRIEAQSRRFGVGSAKTDRLAGSYAYTGRSARRVLH